MFKLVFALGMFVTSNVSYSQPSPPYLRNFDIQHSGETNVKKVNISDVQYIHNKCGLAGVKMYHQPSARSDYPYEYPGGVGLGICKSLNRYNTVCCPGVGPILTCKRYDDPCYN